MKKEFEKPELMIVMFNSEDVIRTSDPLGGIDDSHDPNLVDGI